MRFVHQPRAPCSRHAATMDAGLAQHLREVGFDTRTETLRTPGAIPPVARSGCGSAT